MEKKFGCLLVIMLGVSLSQFKECSSTATNTTTIINTQDEESLSTLRHQVEFLNSFNDKLLHQIEMLLDRLNQCDKLVSIQNTKGRQIRFLNSFNDKLLSQIEMLSARLNYYENRTDTQYTSSLKQFDDPQNTGSSTTQKYPRNCAEIGKGHANGTFTIQISSIEEKPFIVSCNDSYDGGWTVIQRRQDGNVDFHRNWTDYKNGFGDIEGDFFIGLDKLHALTKESSQELLIVLSDFEGETRYAKYDSFAIGDESEAYALKVLGNYSGNAGDSLRAHFKQKFSTKDRDNDSSARNCATHKGGWWYADCITSNLNGLYFKERNDLDITGDGITWMDWHGPFYVLKYVQMMIRPRRN